MHMLAVSSLKLSMIWIGRLIVVTPSGAVREMVCSGLAEDWSMLSMCLACKLSLFVAITFVSNKIDRECVCV